MAAPGLHWKYICALFCLFVVPIHGLKEITAQLGQCVNLTCRGHKDAIGLNLTRSDLDPPYIFYFRNNRPDLTKQNILFQDRVGLHGPLVTDDDSNVTLYLRNVSWSDNGTYGCSVFYKGGEQPVKSSFAVRVKDSDGESTPAGGTPTGTTPAGGTPTEGIPTEGTPAGGTTTGTTPAGGTPTEGTPAGGTTTGTTPAGGTPTEGIPTRRTLTGTTRTGSILTEGTTTGGVILFVLLITVIVYSEYVLIAAGAVILVSVLITLIVCRIN